MARPVSKSQTVGLVTLRKKGRYWYARYPVGNAAGDAREERSLKVTNQRVALEKAKEIDVLLQEGGVTSLAERRRGHQTTFERLVEEFCATYDGWSDSTWHSNKHRLRFLVEEFGDFKVDAVSPRMIESYLSRRRDQDGLSPASRNRYLAALKTTFKMAVNWGYIVTSPAAFVKMVKEEQQIPEALSDDELNRLLAELPEPTRRIFILAVDTGMRKSELQRLRWSDVDSGEGFIRIRDTKNNEFRVVPMTERVQRTLEELKAERARQAVRDLRVTPFTDIRDGIESAARRAGIVHVHMQMLRHNADSRIMPT